MTDLIPPPPVPGCFMRTVLLIVAIGLGVYFGGCGGGLVAVLVALVAVAFLEDDDAEA